MQPYDVIKAIAQGRRAMRRGQLAEAERWYKLADHAAAIAQRLNYLADKESKRS